MARISGVTLPKDKRAVIGLTYIFGIGKQMSIKILKEANIDEAVRIKDLTETQENKIREIIDKDFKVEGELKRETLLNVKRLKEINSYRGSRHAKNLPSRGQRTKTNNRTRRGNKRQTMGSGRRASSQKT